MLSLTTPIYLCSGVSRAHTDRRVTSCARGRTICPRPCTPHAEAQLQPIHVLRLACGAQRALRPVFVGAMKTDRRQTRIMGVRLMPPVLGAGA